MSSSRRTSDWAFGSAKDDEASFELPAHHHDCTSKTTVLAAALFYIPSFISLYLLVALTNVVPFPHNGIGRFVHRTQVSVSGRWRCCFEIEQIFMRSLWSFTSATGRARHE